MTDSEFIMKTIKVRKNLMTLDLQLNAIKHLLPSVSKNSKLHSYFNKLSNLCTETYELFDEIGPEITKGSSTQ